MLKEMPVFTFPRMSHVLPDSSVAYEVRAWNGAAAPSYDMLSIGMVLAELEGDEVRLRALDEIHIEGRDARVQACLNKK
jgi:hypothetical protein